MSEAGDFNPGPWKGHSFTSARQAYKKHVDRGYGNAVNSGKDPKSLVPSELTTNSPAPLIIACDVTGSMEDWPTTIFSKLPYLELEGQEYLGKGMEICFMAVGDAFTDRYPLQARPFTKGTKLKKRLTELVVEGNGGGQSKESYDLAALYCARKISMPRAINKPILIFVGDEGVYDFIDKQQALVWVSEKLKGRLSAKSVFDELKRIYSVYIVRKPYNQHGDRMSGKNLEIHKQWVSFLGEDHVSILPDPNRVVDVIFGILAKETGRVEYFREEFEDRQKDRPEYFPTVYKALHTIHALPKNSAPKALPPVGRSVMLKAKGGAKKTKSLLGDD